MLTAGSLCSGYGGLDLAVAAALGARLSWVAETDPGCARILRARAPGVLNVGDIAVAGWRFVEPVDILCGGFPCQPASAAGRRKGTDDTRWLFPFILDCVRDLDPRPWLLVLENVPGLLSVNDGSAFAEVVYGLAELGYVGRYGLYRACDVGAPHRRTRLFIVAADPVRFAAERPGIGGRVGAAELGGAEPGGDAAGDPGQETGRELGPLLPTPTARHQDRGHAEAEHRHQPGRPAGRGGGASPDLGSVAALLPTPVTGYSDSDPADWAARKSEANHGADTNNISDLQVAVRSLLPTPQAEDSHRGGRGVSPGRAARRRDAGRQLTVEETVALLLPTPQAHDAATPKTPAQLDAARARHEAARGRPSGMRNLNEVAAHDLPLLPTPSAAAADGGQASRSGDRRGELLLGGRARRLAVDWGKYEPAVRRWEAIFGPAPCPVEAHGRKIRLAAPFAEWMMGLPAGWVTAVPGLSRGEQLRAIGNGVVPQQGETAITDLVLALAAHLNNGLHWQRG